MPRGPQPARPPHPSHLPLRAGGYLSIITLSAIRYLSIYLGVSLSPAGRSRGNPVTCRLPGPGPSGLRCGFQLLLRTRPAPPAPYGTGQAVRLARWRPPGRSLALLASRRAAPRSCVQCMAALTVGFVVVAERGRHVRRHGPASYVHRSVTRRWPGSERACV